MRSSTPPSAAISRCAEDSPVLALGFKNFPMNEFGVTSPGLRAIARTPSLASNAEPVSTRDRGVRDWLGAKVRNIAGRGEQSAHGLPGETGVLVLDVPAGSALAKADLRANDVIIAAGGATIDQVSDLSRVARATVAGAPLKISVSRDQQLIDVTVRP